ncbi:MAG: helix-turn-helix transcriptional regulator, partial [Pseudomonadota bacterium]
METQENRPQLGDILKAARKQARLTQDDVARHFQINRVSVSNWESGQTKPDATKLPELEQLLHVDLTPHMTPGWAEIARKHGE